MNRMLILSFRELKLRHVKLVREKKEMMGSVSIIIATNISSTITTINSTIAILGCYIRREM